VIAVRTNSRDILSKILQNGSINEQERGEALIEALNRGHFSDAELLLKSFLISQDARSKAAVIAVRTNSRDILSKILQNGSINEQERGEALIEALDRGHFSDAELLMGALISQDVRSKAAVIAVKQDQPVLLREILENGPIHEKEREEVLVEAFNRKPLFDDAIRSQSRYVTDNIRFKAAMLAMHKQDANITRRILENSPLHDEEIEEALLAALHRGDLDGAEILLKFPFLFLSMSGRSKAAVIAAKKGSPALLQRILKNGSIYETQRGEALIEAVRAGTIASVCLLLQSGPIWCDHEEAVRLAVALKRTDISELLQKNAPSMGLAKV
jgi:hypothetical protein